MAEGGSVNMADGGSVNMTDGGSVNMTDGGGVNSPKSGGTNESGSGIELTDKVSSCNVDDINIFAHLPSRQLADILTDKSLHRKSIKQKVTMHHCGRLPESERLADKIAKVITEDMQDEPDVDSAAVEILRDMTGTTLAMKKKIRKNVCRETPMDGRNKKLLPNWIWNAKYMCLLRYEQVSFHFGSFIRFLTLWKSSVKKIEGRFGSGVSSYFRFLRWLLFLNIPVFVLSLFFIILPFVLYRKFGKYLPDEEREGFSFVDLILGNGFMRTSEMFYGFYQPVEVNLAGSLSYQIEHAYLFTTGSYLLFCLLILAYCMVQLYRTEYVRGKYDTGSRITERVLCGWQNGVICPYAASLHHRALYNEFSTYLYELRESGSTHTFQHSLRLFIVRVIINIVAVVVIGASLVAVFFTAQKQKYPQKNADTLALPGLICLISFVVPFAFNKLGKLEKFGKLEIKLYLYFSRIMLLKAGLIAVLLYYWYKKLPCSLVPGKNDTSALLNDSSVSSCVPCWETEMAQQIYRLVIIDFLYIIITTFCFEFLAKYLRRCIMKRDVEIHFNIGLNILDIIFSQVLIWIGTFFAPYISLVMIIKLIFIFYFKQLSATMNLKPSDKPCSTSRIHTFFMACVFAFYALSLISTAISIIFIKPANVCGPFRNLDTVMEIVTNKIKTWKDSNLWIYSVIEFISSSGCVAAIIIFFCIGNYFAWIIKNGHREMVVSLKDRLTMEGRDKAYLMKKYRELNYDLKVFQIARHVVESDTASVDTFETMLGGNSSSN